MLAGIYVSGVLDLGKVAFSEGTAEFVAADPRPGVGVALVAHWSRREGARRGQRRRAALRPPFLCIRGRTCPRALHVTPSLLLKDLGTLWLFSCDLTFGKGRKKTVQRPAPPPPRRGGGREGDAST